MKQALLLFFVLPLFILASCNSTYTSQRKIQESASTKKFNDARTWAALKGKWYGKQRTVAGLDREWLIEHKADGTYVTTFQDTLENGDVKLTTEYGDWGVSGYVYFTIFDGMIEEGEIKPSETTEYWSRDAYEIVKVNLDEFIYRDLEKHVRFRVIRKTKDFEL